MTATKWIKFGSRGFWAYDVSAGIFLKYLIDEAEVNSQANTPWLADAISSWRVQAAITEFGLTIKEEWSPAQRQTFIDMAEQACKKIATREAIPAKEIASWPLEDDLRIHPRGATEFPTAPVVELGLAIIALVSGNLRESPKDEAWFYGTPEGRSTIKMNHERNG